MYTDAIAVRSPDSPLSASHREDRPRNMYLYYRTSLLTSRAQTLVNTVNCVGVMGKGLALAFKQKYPKMFQEYQALCEKGRIKPGGLWLWHGPDHLVLNFATKDHWRNPSRLEWIEQGLRRFRAEYERLGVTEISFPRLGCGNGGLDWEDVRPVMERYLCDLPITVFVHDYEVDIGRAEHEKGGRLPVPDGQRTVRSFEGFLAVLGRVIDRKEGMFKCFGSLDEFKVVFRAQDLSLEMSTDFGAITMVEEDDLRATWIAMLNGLVTRENIGASSKENVERLIAIVGEFPGAKFVQVQRVDSAEPQVAVEFRGKPKAPTELASLI